MQNSFDVVIVGAGAGGLVLALLLARQGRRVAIVDRQSPPMPPPRGEILQPNGLKVLDRLGLLAPLLTSDVHLNHEVCFAQVSGDPLCMVNYRRLPKPYAYSLIFLPEVLQRLLLERVEQTAEIETLWGGSFEGLQWQDEQVVGLDVRYEGVLLSIEAALVVGSDGVRSRVREAFALSHQVHVYSGGYLTFLTDLPDDFGSSARYYLGQGQILGAFPVSTKQLYLFYLLEKDEIENVKSRGLKELKSEILSLSPAIRELFMAPLESLQSWSQTAFMPCFRVRCSSWCVSGGVLLGDAAHAMNPHVAQGRNAAMQNAVVLSEVINDCFGQSDFSRQRLAAYEEAGRKDIDQLQGLGDEMVLFWNSKIAPMCWLRDRVFRGVAHRPALHDKLLSTVSGVAMQPFNLRDRLDALR